MQDGITAAGGWSDRPVRGILGDWTAAVEQEQQWIDQCLAGDETAYGHLLTRYRQGIYNLAYRMLGNAEDANDAAQEVFVKVFLALDKYDRRFKFSSWIYRIATNFCIDTIRRRKPTLSLDDGGEDGLDLMGRIPDRNPDPSDSVMKSERDEIIQRAIEQLDPKYKAMILLRHQQDLSYDEIASILGLPLGTVKVRVHRARERLRDLLSSQMEEL